MIKEMWEKIKNYYQLTKPGVLYGNAITAVAGFLLASQGTISWRLFLATIAGTTLVIASACVINNYLDQDIDQLMTRTKDRPIISGKVSASGALIFGIILGLLGAAILVFFTNRLVVAAGLVGFIVYVFLYGMLSKRLSIHGTLVGSISGAMPIFAGYVAATGYVDIGAVLVFTVLFLWQMPEFYSIAIYRRTEYKAAGIPVITVVKGVEHTKWLIAIYTVAYVIATLLLSVFGITGVIYLAVMAMLGAHWIAVALKGLSAKDSVTWSRRMFRISLVSLLTFSFLISVDAWLP